MGHSQARRPVARLFRTLAKLCAILGLFGILCLAAVKLFLDATYFRGYDASAPLNVREAPAEDLPAFRWTKFYYDGFRGQPVPAVLATPKNVTNPVPCVVFVHGIGNDKEFMRRHNLDEPFVRAGYAFVCFDQLTRGERKLAPGSSRAEAFRVRAAHTVNDTRRLIDYLVTRPDIATNRIYLCGASYGAMTGAIATSFDSRIRAAALIYGGGDLQKLLSADLLRDEIGSWVLPAKALAWFFASVFDPVRYAGHISPRPVLLQNGKADTVVVPAAAEALQAAVNEPKTVIWYEGDHLGKTRDLDTLLVNRVLNDTLKWLNEVDSRTHPSASPQ